TVCPRWPLGYPSRVISSKPVKQPVIFATSGAHVNARRFGRLPAPRRASDVEAEMQAGPLLDPVVLALQPQPPRLPRPGFPAMADEVVEGDGLGADEALFEVGVDDAGGLRGGGAGLDRPRADFLDPGGEIGLQPEQAVGSPDHPVQARLLQTQVGQELVPVGVV